MKIEVLWTPSELAQVAIHDHVAVVVDVLRASTTIVTAIDNGARAVVPAASIEEAIKIGKSLGRDEAVLAGERQGDRIQGFDLGNSPAEFTAETVCGRTIVMATTNGTRTLAALAGAQAVYVAALMNRTAVSAQLAEVDGDALIVCAGRSGRVAAEDAVCAGLIVEAGLQRWPLKETELGDGALAALALARQQAPIDVGFLRRTEAGRDLERIGQANDLELCAAIDVVSEVPVLRDRQISGAPRPVAARETELHRHGARWS